MKDESKKTGFNPCSDAMADCSAFIQSQINDAVHRPPRVEDERLVNLGIYYAVSSVEYRLIQLLNVLEGYDRFGNERSNDQDK